MGPSGGCTTRPVCTSCAQGVGGVYHGPYSPTLREWACPLAGEPTPHPASRTRGLRRLMRGATTISRTRGCATGAVSGRTPLPFFWSCTHLFHHPDQADHPCGPPRQAPPPPPPRPLAQAHTSPYLLTDAPQHAPFCSSSCGTRPPRARVCEGGRRVRALARMELFSGSPHESNHIDPGSELLLTEAVGSAFATQVQQNSGDVLGIDVEQPSLRSCR